jgi:hypothetical protein
VDQAGRDALPGGQALYNFYDHPVELRFDIDSITGEPGAPGARNVFYVSIGDDADENYVPLARGMDHGMGFCVEKLNTGGGPFWRILFNALQDGQLVDDASGTVAIVSAAPSALSLTLDKGLATLRIEGATVIQMGGRGKKSRSGGDAIEVFVPDLSSLVSGYTLSFGAYNLGTVGGKTAVRLEAFYAAAGPGPVTVGGTGLGNGGRPTIALR